jgi:hypothetical protein
LREKGTDRSLFRNGFIALDPEKDTGEGYFFEGVQRVYA